MIEEQNISSAFNALKCFEKRKEGVQIGSGDVDILTGQTPKEVIWTKNKARLYLSVCEKRFPFPLIR
jgi:hypothetical protein